MCERHALTIHKHNLHSGSQSFTVVDIYEPHNAQVKIRIHDRNHRHQANGAGHHYSSDHHMPMRHHCRDKHGQQYFGQHLHDRGQYHHNFSFHHYYLFSSGSNYQCPRYGGHARALYGKGQGEYFNKPPKTVPYLQSDMVSNGAMLNVDLSPQRFPLAEMLSRISLGSVGAGMINVMGDSPMPQFPGYRTAAFASQELPFGYADQFSSDGAVSPGVPYEYGHRMSEMSRPVLQPHPVGRAHYGVSPAIANVLGRRDAQLRQDIRNFDSQLQLGRWPDDDSLRWRPNPRNLRSWNDPLDFDPDGTLVSRNVQEQFKRLFDTHQQ